MSSAGSTPEAGAGSAGGSRPPGPPTRASFTSRAIILALISAALLLTLAVPVRAWFAQRAQIAGLRAEVDAASERVGELQVEKQRWADPAFVAAQARRRLHFVLPGEVGYVTLGSGTEATTPGTEAGSQEPWYSQLWGAVQQADDHGAG